MVIKSSEQPTSDPTEAAENKETGYTEAQKTLGIKVTTLKGDNNVIHIEGSEDGMKAIFREMVDKLGSNQFDHEVEKNWQYVRGGNHLRPGGTYMVTINQKDELTMTVMNVNARDFKPIVDKMHNAVKESIINAASIKSS